MWNLITVGFIWGITSPFLKIGASGIEKINKVNDLHQFMSECLFLLSNWKYLVPYLVNQTGSLLYYFSLQDNSLSTAVPVVNSLAFVVTGLSGRLLGEKLPSTRTLAGMGLVLLGISCYVLDGLDAR